MINQASATTSQNNLANQSEQQQQHTTQFHQQQAQSQMHGHTKMFQMPSLEQLLASHRLPLQNFTTAQVIQQHHQSQQSGAGNGSTNIEQPLQGPFPQNAGAGTQASQAAVTSEGCLASASKVDELATARPAPSSYLASSIQLQQQQMQQQQHQQQTATANQPLLPPLMNLQQQQQHHAAQNFVQSSPHHHQHQQQQQQQQIPSQHQHHQHHQTQQQSSQQLAQQLLQQQQTSTSSSSAQQQQQHHQHHIDHQQHQSAASNHLIQQSSHSRHQQQLHQHEQQQQQQLQAQSSSSSVVPQSTTTPYHHHQHHQQQQQQQQLMNQSPSSGGTHNHHHQHPQQNNTLHLLHQQHQHQHQHQQQVQQPATLAQSNQSSVQVRAPLIATPTQAQQLQDQQHQSALLQHHQAAQVAAMQQAVLSQQQQTAAGSYFRSGLVGHAAGQTNTANPYIKTGSSATNGTLQQARTDPMSQLLFGISTTAEQLDSQKQGLQHQPTTSTAALHQAAANNSQQSSFGAVRGGQNLTNSTGPGVESHFSQQTATATALGMPGANQMDPQVALVMNITNEIERLKGILAQQQQKALAKSQQEQINMQLVQRQQQSAAAQLQTGSTSAATEHQQNMLLQQSHNVFKPAPGAAAGASQMGQFTAAMAAMQQQQAVAAAAAEGMQQAAVAANVAAMGQLASQQAAAGIGSAANAYAQQLQAQQLQSLSTNHIIDNMRTPNIFDIGPISMQKTSKRILNQNAVKFKLSQLKTTSIRYEVIYKNLVRDLRKYYSQDFNQMKMKRFKKLEPSNFTEVLEGYIKTTFSEQIARLNIPVADLIFNLGSLIYPKLMLKLLKNNALVKVQVVSIYNYLYKFSLERLQHFLNNECLMLLFVDYLRINGYSRIHSSPNMVKYRHAYYEACNIMIDQSAHKVHLAEFFSMHDVFRAPTEHEFENEISTSALQQRRMGKSGSKGGEGGANDCCDDEDDIDDEDLNDLSNEPVHNRSLLQSSEIKANDPQAYEFNVLHSIPVKVVSSAETVTEDALQNENIHVTAADVGAVKTNTEQQNEGAAVECTAAKQTLELGQGLQVVAPQGDNLQQQQLSIAAGSTSAQQESHGAASACQKLLNNEGQIYSREGPAQIQLQQYSQGAICCAPNVSENATGQKF